MTKIKFNIPLKAFVRHVKKTGKDHYFRMNLNEYRNAKCFVLNAAKVNYNAEIAEIIPEFKAEEIKIDYTIYSKTNRVFDLNNVASILDKYLCDAIVELGYLPDDNYNHIPELPTGRFGGKDADNPRAEVKITIIK